MKRFVFRLETVLRHRKTIEELREQDFALAQGRHMEAKLQLEALEEHYRRTVAERPGAEFGFDAPAIQSREKYLQAVQERIAEQAERVEVARIIAEEMRLAMVAAKQAREAVSRLREDDLAEHTAETQRLMQEGLDEVAATRFARLNAARTSP
ncbi:MAG TPA: flagellar export protein FliJ [Chthonomonadaceae bacterium]|nr:flagellar export protein FliJ [Chthonomonadaceae bacterium]